MKKLGKKQKLAILKGARARVARPGGWVKGTFSSFRGRDKDGESLYGYCVAGAAGAEFKALFPDERMDEAELCKVLSLETLAQAKLASKPRLKKAVDEDGAFGVYMFNDAASTRKADVIALFDEKIAELEASA